jgi:hypothetical protein
MYQLLQDSNRIRAEIARLYDEDPQGWRVLTGRDRHGFYDLLISHETEAWQLKEYQVNPYKFVGLGSKLSDLPQKGFSEELHFGLRPIGSDQMKELANVIDDPLSMSDLASRLLKQNPVTSNEAMNVPAILHGPILQSPRPIDAISSAHSELDEKLRKQLRQIINRDFRHTVTPYI